MTNIIDIIKAIIYGIVEGITEWLPVSSTGHMILLNEFMKMDVSKEFWEMFLVVVQLGAILAVIVYYWKKIVPWDVNKTTGEHFWSKPKLMMWVKIAIATIPAAVVGLFLDDYLNKYFYNPTVVGIMLILFGVFFILVENKKSLTLNKLNLSRKGSGIYKEISDITFTQVIIIGLFQMIAAVFPGTSRSGATILAGLILGITRSCSAEFTFFLAIPAMLGSSLLKLIKFGFSFTTNELSILIFGTLTAFIVSIFVIKYLMLYIKKHNFEVFGIYRIVIGLVVLCYFGFSFVSLA